MKINAIDKRILPIIGAICLAGSAHAALIVNSSSDLIVELDAYATDANLTLGDADSSTAVASFTAASVLGTNNDYLDYWSDGDTMDVSSSVTAGEYEFSLLYNIGSYNGTRTVLLQTDATTPGTYVTVATWKMGDGDLEDTGNWGQGPAQQSTIKTATLPAGDYNLRYVGSSAAGIQLDAVSIVAIPEPATLGLVAMMGGGILFIRRRFMI